MTIYADLISGGNFSFPSDGDGENRVRVIEGVTTRAAASRDSGGRYVDISLSPEAVNSYRDFDDFCSGLEAQLSDRYAKLFESNSRSLLPLDELEADLQRFKSFGDALFASHEACEFTTPGKVWNGSC